MTFEEIRERYNQESLRTGIDLATGRRLTQQEIWYLERTPEWRKNFHEKRLAEKQAAEKTRDRILIVGTLAYVLFALAPVVLMLLR